MPSSIAHRPVFWHRVSHQVCVLLVLVRLPRELPRPSCLYVGLQTHTATLGATPKASAGDLSSGPHVHKAGTVPTEPSPWLGDLSLNPQTSPGLRRCCILWVHPGRGKLPWVKLEQRSQNQAPVLCMASFLGDVGRRLIAA